jgi:hypothetical protein
MRIHLRGSYFTFEARPSIALAPKSPRPTFHPNIVDISMSFEDGNKWVMLKCPMCKANAKSTKAGPQSFHGFGGFREHLERMHPEHKIEGARVRFICYDRHLTEEEAEATRLDYSSEEHRK